MLAPRTVYTEPAGVRSFAEWTPAMLRSARYSADSGDLALAAEFCDAAMSDDRVAASLSTRCRGLHSLPITFEAARGTKRLVKALEAGEDWWAAYPEADLALLHAWGIMLGVGLGEHVWTDRGSTINRIVPRLKVWNPRHLAYDWQRRTWTLRIDGGQRIDITPGDGKWILFTPYGCDRPWTRGAWLAIGVWFLLKRYALTDWGAYSQKHGEGVYVASPPAEAGRSTSKEARKELASALFDVQGGGSLVLPPGFTMELVEATANTWQTFEAQKNAADLGIAVTILGQNLSTEVTGPVSTGATLHGRVMQILIDFDAEALSTCIHDQSLTWWANFNFGNADLAPWPHWDTTPPANRKEAADVLKTVAEAVNTLSLAGAPLNVRTLLEGYGVPLQDAKDVEQSGQLFKYHLDYGLVTANEVRERLGLPPVPGGDKPPAPVAPQSSGGEKRIKLFSGRSVRAASGVVQGQLYVDQLTDHARALAAGILERDVATVLDAIDGAESFDELRAGLADRFKGMSPVKLAELTEKVLIMAELAGRHAQNEDGGE